MDTSLMVSLSIFTVMVVFYWLLPYVMPDSIQFGVRIPQGHDSTAAVEDIRQRFHRLLFMGSGVIFLSCLAMPLLLGWGNFIMLAVIAEVVYTHINYYIAFRRLHSEKVRQGWYDGVAVSRSALYLGGSDYLHLLASVYFILPALLLLLLQVFLGIMDYGSLPSMLPTHFSSGGAITGYSPKTLGSVFSMTFYDGISILTIFVIGQVLSRSRQEIDAAKPYTTYEQQTRFKSYFRDMLYTFSSLISISFLMSSLRRWDYQQFNFYPYLLILPIISGYVILIASLLMMGQMGSRLRSDHYGSETTGVSNLDDDHDWKAGLFYYNRDDPSLLVARRFGIGWTLNFAHPLSWIILASTTSVLLSTIMFRLV